LTADKTRHNICLAMGYFFRPPSNATAEKTEPISPFSTTYDSDTLTSPLSALSSSNTITTTHKRRRAHVHSPWRHSVSHHLLTSATPPTSSTVREFRPERQRNRLLFAAFIQWLGTALFCGMLGLFLWGFSQLPLMKVWQVKTFNALMVLASMWLGTILTSSLREYAKMMRWRILASKYRSLREVDLIMQSESLRTSMKLLWTARPERGYGLSKTQLGCLAWVGVNLALAVLVALLGLTYNLETANYPDLEFGLVSVANLSLVRDVWGAETRSLSAELGAANGFGIQGQDYNFTEGLPPNVHGPTPWGNPMTPVIYAPSDWSTMRYYFMDLNIENPNLSIFTNKSVAVRGNCTEYEVVSGGDGIDTVVTFLGDNNQSTTLDFVRVGPGAMTYVGVLNSTCGPRCSEIIALQSVDNETIFSPKVFKCHNTIGLVEGIEPYVQSNQTAELYQLPDAQARVFAGSIGWTGFNYTAGDQYQYVRYPTDSWWSPNVPTNTSTIAGHIMEFAIEGIAAFDNNGPRMVVAGYYPIAAQVVSVAWTWAVTLLSVITGLHFVAFVAVVFWASETIIRDESYLSIAKLLHDVVCRLGHHGCLLTGQELAEALGDVKLRYGVKGGGLADTIEEEVQEGLRFENRIVSGRVRHVGMLRETEELEGEGQTATKRFPPGLYDGGSMQTSLSPPSDISLENRRLQQNRQTEAKRKEKTE
jgi:hypothetical protein